MICMQVRFHIMSERELQEQIAGLRNDADSQLNLQQLSKSLLTLLNLYSAVEAEASSGWAHEAEFHGYYVLLNLGDRGHSKAEPLALWFRRVRSLVLQAPSRLLNGVVLWRDTHVSFKGHKLRRIQNAPLPAGGYRRTFTNEGG